MAHREWTDDELLAADAAGAAAAGDGWDGDDRETRIGVVRDVLANRWDVESVHFPVEARQERARYRDAVLAHLGANLHERLAWVERSPMWHEVFVGELRISVDQTRSEPDSWAWRGTVHVNTMLVITNTRAGTRDEAKAKIVGALMAWLDARNEERRALVEGR